MARIKGILVDGNRAPSKAVILLAAILALAVAAWSGCQLSAPEPTPVRYLPTLKPGKIWLTGPGCGSLVTNPKAPVRYRPKISCSMQKRMLRLEGVISRGLPEDWQTKRLLLRAITERAKDVGGVAEFLREQGFTEVETEKGGDRRHYPPGSVSWYHPYSRLLVLDEVANLDGVIRIETAPNREAVPQGKN